MFNLNGAGRVLEPQAGAKRWYNIKSNAATKNYKNGGKKYLWIA